MNGPANISENNPFKAPPDFLRAIARPVSLLPGENPKELEAIRDMIILEICPQDGIEWLWTVDLIELSWDIQRYRTLRHKALETHRRNAIEQTLRRAECEGIPASAHENAHNQIQRNANEWFEDPAAAVEIEARLASCGFDARAIDIEAIVQARDIFFMFESLIQSAQSRRIVLLREISARRSLGKRTRHLL